MKDLICWLNINVAMTAVMWIPYTINRIAKQGLLPAMGYKEKLPAMSPWAQRAKKAHYNAVENLVIFAPSVLAYLVLGGTDYKTIQCAIGFYFFGRIIHFVSYTFAIPYLRTVGFFLGWVGTVQVIYHVCKLAGK